MSQTYVIFIYECGNIEWSGIGSVHARIGISDGINSTWSHSSSGNETAADISCSNRPNSNVVNIMLDLSTFNEVQPATIQPTNATTQMNSSVPAPNVMAQTSGVVAQASMAASQGKPIKISIFELLFCVCHKSSSN